MSDNLIIPQLLQRLAVVAPEWCKIESRRGLLHAPYDCFCIYEGGESSIVIPTSSTIQDSFDRRMLFGAACEKIDSLGWTHSHSWSTRNHSYLFDIRKGTDHISGGDSSRYLVEAALQALLTALEGREEECPECEGRKKERMFQRREGGGMETIIQDCPACKGSGKKQEVICTSEQLDERFYPCKCLGCGYVACSEEWSSEPTGMTGDHAVVCPKCYSGKFEEVENTKKQEADEDILKESLANSIMSEAALAKGWDVDEEEA